ncbi:hypothetical protein EON73_00140 [bacterium]|nr:MAG: hypothetical protein EON73_00140 [bacterium]
MTDNSEILLTLGFNHKLSKSLNIFWLGVILYSASFTLATTTAVNYIFCQLIQILGIVLFVPTAIKSIQWKFDNTYLKILFFSYFTWLMIVVFRGFSFEYEDIKSNLFDVDLGVFRFLVPLLLLFPKNLLYYKKLFDVIVILSILFVIYDILFRDNLLDLNYTNNDTKFTFEHFTKILCVPSGFILLSYFYHSPKKNLLAVFVLVLSVLFAIIRARRALIIMTVSPLIISFILYLCKSKSRFFMLFLFLSIGSTLSVYGVRVYNENKNGVFSLLTDRMSEDTRSNVEECLFEDMKTQDWIIGKGINGKYFCPGIDLNDTTGYRNMIETDYLNIILKGGIVSLVLLLLILIPAIIKGLFYSNNFLSKAAAIWILLWVLALYPATVYSFSLNHMLVWVSTGICYSQAIRRMPEDSVKMLLSTY